MNIDEIALTKLLVYETENPEADPNTHIRPDDAPPPDLPTLSMIDYLTTA